MTTLHTGNNTTTRCRANVPWALSQTFNSFPVKDLVVYAVIVYPWAGPGLLPAGVTFCGQSGRTWFSWKEHLFFLFFFPLWGNQEYLADPNVMEGVLCYGPYCVREREKTTELFLWFCFSPQSINDFTWSCHCFLSGFFLCLFDQSCLFFCSPPHNSLNTSFLWWDLTNSKTTD